MESKNGLRILDLQMSDMVRGIENAVQFGNPVLLQVGCGMKGKLAGGGVGLGGIEGARLIAQELLLFGLKLFQTIRYGHLRELGCR